MILFDNLYTIVKTTENAVSLQLADKEHPAFKAHFPTKPILAGFLQIDIIAHILNDEVVEIVYTKFLKHICPNDIIVYNIKTTDKRRSISIVCENIKVSEIRYESK